MLIKIVLQYNDNAKDLIHDIRNVIFTNHFGYKMGPSLHFLKKMDKYNLNQHRFSFENLKAMQRPKKRKPYYDKKL
jgi:hypothetical protein